jgi:hypothetical protein
MTVYTKLDMDPANSSTDHYGSGMTGAAFTLDETDSGDNLARQVIVLNNAARDDTLITLTFVGTDADGRPQTEVTAGPDASTTVSTTKYYLTLTSVTPVSTIGANTYDIGYTDVFVSKTIPLNRRSESAAMAAIDVTGTIAFDVEVTYDLINSPDFTWTDQSSPVWLNATNLTNKSADIIGALDLGAQAARVVVNSYTDTAELQAWITQTESR